MPEQRGAVIVVGAHSQSLLLEVESIPREGETVLGSGFEEPLDGGKATNQAVAAARLGAAVRFVSVLGADSRGERARAMLGKEGIDTTWVSGSQRPTDVGFVMLAPSGVPAIATACECSLELDGELVSGSRAAFDGAGVVVCQLEAPQSAAIAAFEIARELGAITVLNPAPAAALEPRLVALTDVLVPNESEALSLAGRAGALPEIALALAAELAVPTVIVTGGPQGAYLAEGGTCETIAAPGVQAIDTTGAGDALVGALACALAQGASMSAAVQLAVAVASRSVTARGTIPSYPSRAEL